MYKQNQGALNAFANSPEPKALANKSVAGQTAADQKKKTAKDKATEVKKQKPKYKDPVYDYFMKKRYQSVQEYMQFDIKDTLKKEKEDKQNYLLS